MDAAPQAQLAIKVAALAHGISGHAAIGVCGRQNGIGMPAMSQRYAARNARLAAVHRRPMRRATGGWRRVRSHAWAPCALIHFTARFSGCNASRCLIIPTQLASRRRLCLRHGIYLVWSSGGGTGRSAWNGPHSFLTAANEQTDRVTDGDAVSDESPTHDDNLIEDADNLCATASQRSEGQAGIPSRAIIRYRYRRFECSQYLKYG